MKANTETMKQEDKQLLLKDLCARVVYGVKIFDIPANAVGDLFLISTTGTVEYESADETNDDAGIQTLYNIKPYLRPMSSMTEDEELECINQYYRDYVVKTTPIENNGWETGCGTLAFYHHIEWLNAHHFDYRGLIEKGLALEAPKGMYKTK